MWHSGIRGKNLANSPGDFSFHSYFSSDCHKNESVTITGNILTLFQTLKLLVFFQVMRNFNGEQDNKIKPFYCFMSLIRLTIYITFVPKDCCLTSMECCHVQLPLKTKYTYLRSTVSMALYPADRHWKGYTNAPTRENTWEQRQATFFTFQLSLLIFICNNLHTAFLLLNTNHSWALTPWLWQHLLPHLTHTEEFALFIQ